MAFDFKAFQNALVTSFEYEFFDDIEKKPSGWFLEVATSANETAQERIRGILDTIRKRKASSLAQDEKDGTDLISARILGWRGLEDGGKPVPYSQELAVQFLTGARSESLRKQLIAAMGDDERPFTRKTPGVS